MSQKLALIVDDSRSARSVLARMLERHGLDVDTAESAEDAITYLARHRPDVIFMDHLMPGMDGLQAVQAIKNDPRTATIPILMYTSQAGDVYLSQARALGAVGVLPKQTRIADVSRALEQLHLIETGALPADTRAPAAAPPAAAAGSDAGPAGAQARLAPLPAELRTAIEALFAEHAVDLRRFVVERLDDNAQRIVGEFRLLLQDAPAPAGPLPVITAQPLSAPAGEGVAPPARSVAASRLPWVAAAAALLVASGLAALWWRGQASRRELALQLEAARAAASRATAPEIIATTPPPAPAQSVPGGSVLVEAVPYGEAALSGTRVERLQPLLDGLVAQGFRGSVQITSYPGNYCLGGSGDALAPAPEDTPVARCEQIGSPPDSGVPAQHQSLAFANMIAAAQRASGGALDVQLLAGGAAEVVLAYPAAADALTAGEWNRVAAVNNRIEVRLVPSLLLPSPPAADTAAGDAAPPPAAAPATP